MQKGKVNNMIFNGDEIGILFRLEGFIMTHLEILKWNERDILNSIERERQKPQNELTQYYINKFEEMLEDIQIVEAESKVK